MRKMCIYCYAYPFDDLEKVRERCEKQVKKLDQETIDWLMIVIDCKINKELDKHTDHYNHESSSNGYY